MTFTSPTLENRMTLPIPDAAEGKMLLHSCCAPCSGEVIEAMAASGLDLTIYFYNPNIHPRDEYELRKNENIAYAQKLGLPFIDADYDSPNWFTRVKGLENEPERGKRCTECFDMRFERTALYAFENGFPMFTSCLGISRWKDFNQINGCGHRAASRYDGVSYWDYNWRKGGGQAECLRFPNGNISTSKNIAAVSIPCATATNGENPKAVKRSPRGSFLRHRNRGLIILLT
jgi:predicted adenine nucleotide alpha hydrolase (AANH) superfamily ATPase